MRWSADGLGLDVIAASYENMEFPRGVDAVMTLLHAGNLYFSENEPWKLRKSDTERLAVVTALAHEVRSHGRCVCRAH